MVALNFNAQGVAPSVGSSYELLPDGKYLVVITDAKAGATRANDGSGKLELTLTVAEGPFAGKKFQWNLNLWNTNPEAAENARSEMSAICHAIGRFQVGQAAELFNQPFGVDVGHRVVPSTKRNDDGTEKPPSKFQNVTGVYTAAGQKIGAQGAGAQQPQQVAPQAPQAPAAPQGFGQPQQPPAPAAGPAPAQWGAPQGQPAAPAAPAGQWGAPAAAGQAPAAAPAAAPQWGAPAGQPAAAPQWGAPAGQPAAAPQWGAPR